MGSEEGKKTGSYENLRMTDKIEITYQAVIEEDGLEGQEDKEYYARCCDKKQQWRFDSGR